MEKILKTALSVGAVLLAQNSGADGPKKNVLFIMVDDLKTSLGCYSDGYAITPAIDGLARDGILYEKAYCQQALSGPSRASIMTGMRPDNNGVTELETWMRARIPDLVTLPQAFRQSGYTTVSVGKTCHGKKNTLDSLSWSVEPMCWEYGKNDEYMVPGHRTGKKSVSFEFVEEEDHYLDIRTRHEAITQMRMLADKEEPFFLAVGFLKPHLPFCAPERFLRLYDSVHFQAQDTARIAGAPALAYHNSEELRGYTDIGKQDIDTEKNINLKKAYYACVSFADENAGVLIEELKRLGLYDNTVIVLLGDHGYHTGECGLWCKSTNYEAACRAPLIIRDPDGRHNARYSGPVEFVDIFPTLTEICGIETPDGLDGKVITSGGKRKCRYAVSQFPRPYPALHNAARRTHWGYTIRSPRFRYVEWYDNQGNMTDTELYRIGRDFQEKHNISGESHKIAGRKLSRKLAPYIREFEN
ncbi:MAG: sulfatase [Bacteroidales bacterium]|nr:sulfatase [Bacteroidales bacterium]